MSASSPGRAAGDVVWLVGSSYVGQVVGLVVSIALRRVLGPASMGFVALSQLAASYAPFLTLGVAQAAEREVALEIGRGRPDVADRLEHTAAALALASGAVVAGGALFIGALALKGEAAVTVAASGVIVLSQQVAVWATIRLRTRYRFRSLGIWGAAGSVIAIGLTLIGAIVEGLSGALVGFVAGSLTQGIMLGRTAGLGRPQFSAASFRRLVPLAPGFLAVGLTAMLLNSVDQIAVASLLGPTALGVYSAAYLGNAFLVRVPNLVGSVIYPRLQRDLGEHDDIPRLHATVRRTTEATMVAMGPLIAIMFVGLPLVVWLVLPAFASAIGSMRLLLVGVAGLAVAVPASQLLVTIDRIWRQVGLTAAVALGMIVCYVLAGTVGAMSIEVAALVDAVAYSLYGAMLQVAAARAAGADSGWLGRPLAVIALPLLSMLAVAVAWDARGMAPGIEEAILGAVAQAVAFGLTWLVVVRLYVAGRPTLTSDLRAITDRALHRLRWRR